MEPAPIEWAPDASVRHDMEVNYFGLRNVVKAFLPQLQLFGSGSRVVCVTSMVGLMPAMPFLTGYACSKHAADCFVNSLRVEMAQWGVQVINVNPGTMSTNFVEGAEDKLRSAWETADPSVRERYGETYFDWTLLRTRQFVTYLASTPDDCVSELVHATTSAFPKTRYFTGADSRLLGRWVVHVPDWLWDSVVGVLFRVGRPVPQQLSAKL